jgi:ketosteroid isomerase-like protein
MSLTTEDILEIQGLAARYNHAIDSGDAEGYIATFSEKGTMTAGPLVLEGHDALGQFAKSFSSSVREPRHVATNLVIDGDGDKATLKAYVQMYILAGDEGEPAKQTLMTSGKYDDVLAKENGSWKFVRRVFTADS